MTGLSGRNKTVRVPGIIKDTKRFDSGPDVDYAVPKTGPQDKGMPRPWRIGLTVIDMQVELVFNLSEEMHVGRSYPSTDLYEGVDLSPYNAFEKGVSRKHATLRLKGERVYLVDNKSANGTFVNGKRIPPDEPYPLRNGDRVKLGTLNTVVQLLTNPFELM
jgi:hypothetical protein